MEQDPQIVAPTADASELGTREQDTPSPDIEAGSFDPVDILMDYMLTKTDAKYAAAEFDDILAIFSATDIPDDIMAGLEAINPPIEVDEHGVARVVVNVAHRSDELSSTQSGSDQVDEIRRDPRNREHAEDTLCE